MFTDFRKRGGEYGGMERQTDRHRLVASHMCPDWELNPQPFGVGDDVLTD